MRVPRGGGRKLKWLIESDGPALLEVLTDKKVPVLPTVPSGNALHEFLVYDEGMRTLRNFFTSTNFNS